MNFKSLIVAFIIQGIVLQGLVFSQTANFSVSMESPCVPATIVIENSSSTGPGVKHLWDFGKGGTVFNDSPTLYETFTESGDFTIILKVISGTDTTQASQNITVVEGPVANFSVSPAEGCPPLSVTFSDNSVEGDAAISTSYWDLRNGYTTTGNPASYEYSTPGLHGVYYKVTDANGCTDYVDMGNVVNVYSLPVAAFSASENFSCESPLSVTFSNQSTGYGGISSSWDFGNGQTSGSNTGQASFATGTWDVSLQVTDQHGCSASLIKDSYITVGQASGEIYAISNEQYYTDHEAIICPGMVNITSTLPPLKDVDWRIEYAGSVFTASDTNRYLLLADTPGRMDIRLIFEEESGCGDTLYKSFIVDDLVADFTMDADYACQLPTVVSFTNTSQNAGAIDWLFTPLGQNTVNFTIVQDTSYSTLYSHKLSSRDIHFSLVAESAAGCRDTVTKTFNVTLPIARFMPDISSGCAPLEVVFSDSSQSDYPLISWLYSIEGTEITQPGGNPLSYTFASPGTYQVSLAVENERGCTDTSYPVNIYVGEKLEPNFSVNPASLCSEETLNLIHLNPDPEVVDSWQYYSPGLFNTGAILSPDTSLVIRADHDGPFDITLAVNNNGCVSDTTLENIASINSPTAYIEEIPDCGSPLDYVFVAHAEHASNYTWKLGEDTLGNLDTLEYSFTATGDYLLELEVMDAGTGCRIAQQKIIPVRDVVANFISKDVVCLYEEFLFDARSSVDYTTTCFNEGFLWDFNDNRPPRRNHSPVQKYAYMETGNYEVELLVLADNGCVDTITRSIEVVQPTVEFTADPDSGCGPQLEVNFSYIPDGANIESWTWLFGDGMISVGSSPDVSHNYVSYGNYQFYASLIIEDEFGCRNLASQTILVKVPEVDFQALDNALCLGETTQLFINTPDLLNPLWDYGDGSPPTSSPSHEYTQAGIYDVRLTGELDNCAVNILRNNWVSVEQADATYMVNDTVFTCYPANAVFTHTGTNSPIAQGNWTFEPGIQSPGYSSAAEYTYESPGSYLTSLHVTTANGCVSSSSHIIEVSGPVADFTYSSDSICSGESVQFTAINFVGVDDFHWEFGDGNISNELNPLHTFLAQGNLFPTLNLVQEDCIVPIEKNLYVSTINADFTLLPELSSYCTNIPVLASNNSEDYEISRWYLNGIEVSTLANPTLSFIETGEHSLLLEITNSLGCTDTLEQQFMVFETPEFVITGDSRICPGNQEIELSVEENPNWTIHWEPVNTINNQGGFTTTATIDTSTVFTAIVSSEENCSSSEQFAVILLEPSLIERQPRGDTSIFIGQSVNLYIDSGSENTQYFWSPDYNISCTNCTSPSATPHVTTNYSCHVLDECLDVTLDFLIEVIADFYLELPKAFSPNGDGVNDILLMEHNNITHVDFKIFNRWGSLMFSTEDINEGWDGRSSGKLQNPDSYAYIIRASTIHGYEFERKGTFVLVR